MTYIIDYVVADIINFDIRKKWFDKYSCTCGLQTLLFDNWIVGGRGDSESLNCWRRNFPCAQSLEYYFIKNICKKLFFSPVLHCIPDALPYVVVRFSSIKFSRKILLRCGANHANSIAHPFLTVNVNTLLTRLPNSESGSFCDLLLIPKAQDAMTSVVNLAIVSFTCTVEPDNSPC
jgi:hypothetical protein